MKQDNLLVITGSPQFYDESSTVNIIWSVVFCLLPAAGWGVYSFGYPAAAVLAVSVGTSLAVEGLVAAASRRFTLWDGSAFLTGLLLGMTMPPSVPLHIPAAAALFAVGVVKWTFGGLGRNWMNPALAGRVFAFFSWTGPMSTYTAPVTLRGVDGVSAATPLGFLKSIMVDHSGSARTAMEALSQNGFPRSLADGMITDWLNAKVLEPIGISLPQGYVDLFIGNTAGSLGETSALLLLAGTIFLIGRKVVTWHVPVSYFGSFGLLVFVFGGLRFDGDFFTGDVLFHLFSGGLMLGVFYMATDTVTSPLTKSGMLIYGTGAGLLTFLIRHYGAFPEGVALAIIFMNVFVPLINRHTGPSRYGVRKGAER